MLSVRSFWLLVALALGLISGATMATPQSRVVDVATVVDSLNVAVSLDYLVRDAEPFELESLLADQRSPSLPWRQNTTGNPGFGFNTHTHWFRLVVTNSARQQLDRLLEIRNPVLDEVLLYQVNSDGLIVSLVRTGDEWPPHERPLFHHNLILPVSVPAGETHFLYFRVTTSGALEFPVEMWRPQAFQEQDQKQLLFYGALFGVLVVMGLYNFFIYTLFRDRSLLYYAGYAFGLMMFLLSIYGFANLYVWPDNAWWREHSLAIIIPVTLFCAIMFTDAFLQLRQSYRPMRILVNAGAGSCAVLFLLAFFVDYAIMIRILAALVFPICTIAIVTGIQRWRDGFQPARYFILAWTVFLLAVSYYSLAKFGVFELTSVSQHAVPWGAVLEMVLFAFALADRLDSQRRSFIREQGKALELQKMANEKLEASVEERTRALRAAMDELGDVNLKLQALTMQDGLTGIYNRRYFDEKVEAEWQRALRNRESLAILVIDIDYFKDFNDRHGHLAGDECLRRVARLIDATVTRPSDAVARFGGEEFVVVLPDTDGDGGVHVAEKIRAAVAGLEIPVEAGITKVSVSIGVAAMVPVDMLSPQALLASADQALYRAKSGGRNRTHLASDVSLQL